ncbi:MAG: hypothetical protein GC200_11310 [Tepidisphaera sp.]|nr:hypothetical protein [Tepidisphaera sp.]
MKSHTLQGRTGGWRALAVVLAAGGALGLGSAALGANGDATMPAADRFADYGPGLANVDIRLNADETPADAVLHARQVWEMTAGGRGVAAAEAAMHAAIPSMRTYRDQVLGTVSWAGATSDWLTGPSKAAPADVVKAFLAGNPALFEIGPAGLDKAVLIRNFETPGANMTHLTWQQQINGLPVENGRFNASVNSDGRLINIGGTFLPEPAEGFSPTKFELNEQAAIKAAARACGIDLAGEVQSAGTKDVNGNLEWTTPLELRPDELVRTRRVYYFVARGDVRAAYWVFVPVRGVGHNYEVIVDAGSGQMLYRLDDLVWDTTQPVTYRVYTSDSPSPASPGTPTPSGMQFPFVPRDLVTVQPADISAIDSNGWIPDGGTQTVGNNVDAYLDAANDNTASPADRATSATRVFDFALPTGADNAPTAAPSTYRDASITQLFYLCNLYHDHLWTLGFNEAAGNFQLDNLGRGGLAGDYVRAECQDGSGTNNANFSTSGTDGSTGRVQMYIFTAPTPQRDGSLDGDVVFHELTHGTSIRLHGPQGGLQSGTQNGGMGEGWGDYVGISMLAQPSDDFSAVYSTGSFVTRNLGDPGGEGNLNTYYGIRRYPYSIDLTKSPLLYGDTTTVRTYSAPRNPVIGNSATEVHNVGEIWCNTLLEGRYQISLTEGFSGNNTMLQLVIDGMKLAPAGPNFLQERDAILQADMNRYGGAHQLALWRAFAKRGMGANAFSSGTGTADVVENFDLPFRVDYTFPNGTPAQLSPTQATTFPVHIAPVFVNVTPGSGQLFYSIDGGAFTSVPLAQTGANDFNATLPAAPCFSTFRYYVSFGTDQGNFTSPSTAPAATYAGQIYTGTNVAASDDMETDQGWTVTPGSPAATTGIWNRLAPSAINTGAGLPIQPGADHTPDPGTKCWVTDGNPGVLGQNDVDNGITVLTSPAYNLAGTNDPIVEYWRWYANNGNTVIDDTFLIQVSTDNGATWHTAENIATATNAWALGSWRLRDLGLTPTSQVRLRFNAADIGGGSIVEAAIDDLKITDRLCVAGPTCDPDVNQDGVADQGDVDYLINVVAGGANPTGINADFNGDGVADQGDVDALVNVVAGGPCP